jgi:hypothetical protein
MRPATLLTLGGPCAPSTSGRSALAADFSAPPPLRHRRAGPLRLAVTASASPRREMSLQQRWRAFKFAVEDKKKELATAPPVAALLAALAAVRAALQPLYDLMEAFRIRREAYTEAYNQFLADETRVKWTWAKKNRKELDLLAEFPAYALVFVSTLAFHAFTPVSALFNGALPLYAAWALWERWYLSPVFVASLIMWPLKFAPWGLAYFSWVWPGVV